MGIGLPACVPAGTVFVLGWDLGKCDRLGLIRYSGVANLSLLTAGYLWLAHAVCPREKRTIALVGEYDL